MVSPGGSKAHMSKGEKLTVFFGAVSAIGVCIQIALNVMHEREHQASIMSTILQVSWWVVLLLVTSYSIYRNLHDAKREKNLKQHFSEQARVVEEIVLERRKASAQAALLWHYAGRAKGLAQDLEQLWHHWNDAGERLIRPVSSKAPDMKTFSLDLLNERRDFMVRYMDNIVWIQADIPEITSNFLTAGYPNDDEYTVVMRNIQEHSRLLNEAADKVWNDGRMLEKRNAETN